jgi:predicted O-methyltransferase YrrM
LVLSEDDTTALNIPALLERADDLLRGYERAMTGMPRETEFKGVCASEMFFVYAAIQPYAPRQILESGRCRGESTLTLARCFPDTRIVSVEYDSASTHAPIAEAKLQPYANVDLLYGDSRDILPGRLQTGDVILLDGPKEFRALKLAARLLRTGKPSAVFIHDFSANAPARKFIERSWPRAFFSDDPEFIARFREMDARLDPTHDPKIYGTFLCLPPGLPAPYPVLLFRIITARAAAIVREKLTRFWQFLRPQSS